MREPLQIERLKTLAMSDEALAMFVAGFATHSGSVENWSGVVSMQLDRLAMQQHEQPGSWTEEERGIMWGYVTNWLEILRQRIALSRAHLREGQL